MATYFGKSSPIKNYQTRIRWIIGCLISIILVLVATLTSISLSPSLGLTNNPTEVVFTQDEQIRVDVLFSKQRIEVGSKLNYLVLTTQAMDPKLLPEGAVLAKETHRAVDKFAKTLIPAGFPIRLADLSKTKPYDSLPIPPGYRAVTITVDNRSGVEGHVKPHSRVDVLCTYEDKNRQTRIIPIVPSAKVLSVAGITKQNRTNLSNSRPTTISLLVTKLEAQKVELARIKGKLSLSLLGETEGVDTPTVQKPLSWIEITGDNKPKSPQEFPHIDGFIKTTDPITGESKTIMLIDDVWQTE